MGQQMLEVYNWNLEFITPQMKSFLGNLDLNQAESQLDHNFCLDDKANPKKNQVGQMKVKKEKKIQKR